MSPINSMENYLQGPHIAANGKACVNMQPLLSSANCQPADPVNRPRVVRTSRVENSTLGVAEASTFRRRLCNQEAISEVAASKASRERNEPKEVEMKDHLQKMIALGASLLSHLGELAMGWRPGKPPNARILNQAAFPSLIERFKETKDAIHEFLLVEDEVVGQETGSDLLVLCQVDSWVTKLLSEFLGTTSDTVFTSAARDKSILRIVHVASQDLAVHYVQRVLSACEMHTKDGEASSKEIGNLWMLYVILSFALKPKLGAETIECVGYLVRFVCGCIALRSSDHGLLDPDIAAVVEDTMRKA